MALDISVLVAVRMALDLFLVNFAACIKSRPSRDHFAAYVRGQISNLDHKNVEAIAIAEQIKPRTLQDFLSLNHWDHEQARQRVAQLVQGQHADPEHAVLVVDETGMPKRGDKTPGVKRQYCGELGRKLRRHRQSGLCHAQVSHPARCRIVPA